MRGEQSSEPVTRGEWLALAGTLAIFSLLRLPLFTEPGLHLGWNSDAAIFGFMARAIYRGTDFPIFFWGQSYMGPLTPAIAAVAGFALQPFGVTPAVGPLALRIASAAEVLAGIAFYWIALRRTFDRRVAMTVALWLAIGPAYLFFFTIAPVGAEQMFVLSGTMFWYSVRTGLWQPRHWFVFGLLGGVGWWINQSVVFAIAAPIVIAVLRSRAWAIAWPEPRIIDRLMMRSDRTGWRAVDRSTVALLRTINILLMAWIVDGALFTLDVPVPAFFLGEPLLEPVGIFIAFHLIANLIFSTDLHDSLTFLARDVRSWAAPLLLFAAGALIGYMPVIAGGILHLYPKSYGLSVPPLPLIGMAGHVMTAIRSDFWSFIGATGGGIAIVVALGIVPLFAAAVVRDRSSIRGLLTLRAGDYGARGIAAATMVLCVLFYVTSRRAYPGAMRYIVSALPMLYAFAARELWRLRPYALAAAIAAVITLGLGIPRAGQARDVAGGRGEEYGGLPGGFDPRPVLQTIESQGYSICYADYWIGYKLQWVSDDRVRFVPFHTFDRTPALSRALDAAPGRKCYVDGNGRVRVFRRSDFNESIMNAARERLKKLRAENAR